MKKNLLKTISYSLFFLPLSALALDQWASSVIGFSSQFTTTTWSASQATKAPNVAAYGDNSNAWTTSTADAGVQYISVSYATPVNATGATVRETWNPGFVTKIEAIDTANVAHVVWAGVDKCAPAAICNFTVNWAKTSYLVKGLKVSINTQVASWQEIDAIQLRGIQALSGTITPRYGNAATLICKNNTTNVTKTVVIKGAGTASVTAWDCEKAGLVIKLGDSVTVQFTGTISH